MNAEQAARAIEEWVLKWKPTLTAERLGITKATLAAIVEGEQDVEADLLDVVEEWVQAEQEQQEQRRHEDWVAYHRRCEYGR